MGLVNNPRAIVKEPWPHKVTSTPGDYGYGARLAKVLRVNHFGIVPIQAGRHGDAAKAKRRVRQLLAVIKISFKRIARIKPIVVYDHDQRILPPRCQLVLNRADKLRCWHPILGAVQNTHSAATGK